MGSEAIANLIGTVSVICWIIVFTPQIWKNYQMKSGEGLSTVFLWIWLVGDFFSVTGAVMEHLLPTVIILGVYHAVADLVLISQIYYYRQRQTQIDQTERRPLLLTTIEPVEDPDDRQPNLITFAWVAIACFTFATWSIVMIAFASVSLYMGWTSAILYVASRIPQIVKNAQRQSVEGLSLNIFLLGIIGNLTYCASILIQSLEKEHIIRNLPWLVGSGGTLFFDIAIGFQFYLFQ